MRRCTVPRCSIVALLVTLALACESAKPETAEPARSIAPPPEPVAEGVAQAPVPEPAPQSEPAAASGQGGESGEKPKKDEEKKDEKPRRGIPVTEPLILKHCIACHKDEGGGMLGRLSFMRKTPEGWELSLKRMIRLHGLTLTPEEARQIVRYLANDHGLARDEARRASYEVERRVHWSEKSEDKALRETCAECHTLGRVFSERRDEREWKLLKATHLAYFPLAQWQAFRGEQRNFDWNSLSESEAEERWEQMNRPTARDRADEVLEKLAKELPLFTPEWERWQVDRREVPVAGTWDIVGHEPSRGDLRGTLSIVRTDADAFETKWALEYEGGAKVERTGKALFYSGYSWRGRSTTGAAGEPAEVRETLLLSEDWSTLEGRVFSGEYNEIGFDVRLHRRAGATAIRAVSNAAVMVPSRAHELVLTGEGFPEGLAASDFHVGEGVTVVSAERIDAERVKLVVDVARSAKRGLREVSFRALRGPREVVLYDTIDYVKVTPDEGLARVGGKLRPPQLERFEAVAMNRGADDELYTADDFVIRPVAAEWSLAEFPVRENDDDVQFVGAIDARSGVFTPGLDGPNPARRWEANNIGEVFVIAKVKLNVQQIERKPKSKRAKEPAPPPVSEDAPVVMVEREFVARGHLLVMVPLYVQWDRYAWDKR